MKTEETAGVMLTVKTMMRMMTKRKTPFKLRELITDSGIINLRHCLQETMNIAKISFMYFFYSEMCDMNNCEVTFNISKDIILVLKCIKKTLKHFYSRYLHNPLKIP